MLLILMVTQYSKYTSNSEYARVLNIEEFWIWPSIIYPGSEYANVTQGSEYASGLYTSAVNMLRLHRVLGIPDYAWIMR